MVGSFRVFGRYPLLQRNSMAQGYGTCACVSIRACDKKSISGLCISFYMIFRVIWSLFGKTDPHGEHGTGCA
jgi:hypothetical protein